MHIKVLVGLLAVVAGSSLLVGCASRTGNERAAGVSSAMQDVRDELLRGEFHVDVVVHSLKLLVDKAGESPQPYYRTFTTEVNRLEDLAARVRSRASTMKSRGKAYFDAWSEGFKEFQDPDLKAEAEKNRSELETVYSRIPEVSRELGERYDAFVRDLKNVQRFLDADLRQAGSETMKGRLKKSQEEAEKVKQGIRKVLDELAKVAALLAPRA